MLSSPTFFFFLENIFPLLTNSIIKVQPKLSVCFQSVCMSVSLTVYQSDYLSVNLFVCQSVSMIAYLSVFCLSVTLTLCQTVSLSVRESASKSVCLPIYLSVSQYVFMSVFSSV